MAVGSKAVKNRGRRPKSAPGGREALLAAALPAFARLGFEGVDLRSLAASAKVDASLVGHSFGSKFALWAAVIEQLAEEQRGYAADFKAFQDKAVPALERITSFIRWFTERSGEKPYLSMLILRESLNPGERLDLLVSHLLQPFYQELKPLLDEIIEQKLSFVSDPAKLFFLLVNSISAQIASRGALEIITGSANPNFVEEVQQAAIAVFVRR
jgi:TetR/AcrR family transcriptional regulator